MGLGAVSHGVLEWVLWLLIPLAFIVVLFVAWKLVKVLGALCK